MIVARYIKLLLQLWLGKIFVIFDLLAISALIIDKDLIFPTSVYWILAALSFLIANVQIFSQMDIKINKLELHEAYMVMKVVRSELIIKAPILANRNRAKSGRSDDGLDDQGIPIITQLVAKVEIENIGFEDGNLIWEVDLDRSEIPELFRLFEDDVNGRFHKESNNEQLTINARDRYSGYWLIDLFLTSKDIHNFTMGISNNDCYKIYLDYQTRRIGGLSNKSTLLIEGNIEHYRKMMINKWSERKMNDQISLVTMMTKDNDNKNDKPHC